MAEQAVDISLDDVRAYTGGRIVFDQGPRAYRRICTDSREARTGDLFIALKGERFDGHVFLDQALEAGVGGLIVEQPPEGPFLEGHACTVIRVSDSLTALGDLAAGWRRRFSTTVGVLTGSNGKTTTKEMVVAILRNEFSCLWSPGNYNNRIGMPLTLLAMRPEHERAVLEMGMNEPGEIAALTRMAGPQVGALLNIGPAHLGKFPSMEALAAAKAEMIEALPEASVLVFNRDDPRVEALGRQWQGPTRTFGFSEGCAVRLVEAHPEGAGQRIELELDGKRVTVTMQLPGRHNLANAVAAAALASALGASEDAVARGLATARTVGGRFALRRHARFTLVDDSYNANPASMRIALETLEALSGASDRILVLGDMLELGEHSEAAHRELGRQAARLRPALLCVKGAFRESLIEGALAEALPESRVVRFADAGEAVGKIQARMRGGEWILVKGSRGMALETVVQALERQAGEEPAAGA